MFRKILVPTDGSAIGNSALRMARTLARATDAEILLVQAVPASMFRRPNIVNEASRALDSLRAELVDVRVRSLVRCGPPADAILETAQAEAVDLIAMATSGFTGINRLIAGSIAQEVLRGSLAPVLLIRPEVAAIEHLRNVLVPTDGSPGAALALSAALPLCQASGASLTLLRVTEHVRNSAFVAARAGDLGYDVSVGRAFEEATRLRAEDALRHAATRLVGKGYTATGISRVGKPASVIVDVAHEYAMDLIVMSTHARTGAARAILGSVADEVVHQAECPVMLVHWRHGDRRETSRTPLAAVRPC